MARHKKNYKFYLNNKNFPKYYPNFIKLFNKFGIKNHKIIFIKNIHAKTENNPKRKKVNILKMIRTVLANVLLVRLKKKITMPQKSITSKKIILKKNK